MKHCSHCCARMKTYAFSRPDRLKSAHTFRRNLHETNWLVRLLGTSKLPRTRRKPRLPKLARAKRIRTGPNANKKCKRILAEPMVRPGRTHHLGPHLMPCRRSIHRGKLCELRARNHRTMTSMTA